MLYDPKILLIAINSADSTKRNENKQNSDFRGERYEKRKKIGIVLEDLIKRFEKKTKKCS
jgi:hypothetical protein